MIKAVGKKRSHPLTPTLAHPILLLFAPMVQKKSFMIYCFYNSFFWTHDTWYDENRRSFWPDCRVFLAFALSVEIFSLQPSSPSNIISDHLLLWSRDVAARFCFYVVWQGSCHQRQCFSRVCSRVFSSTCSVRRVYNQKFCFIHCLVRAEVFQAPLMHLQHKLYFVTYLTSCCFVGFHLTLNIAVCFIILRLFQF